MDAWSVNYSADIGSYGITTQVSYVAGFKPSFTVLGEKIATTKNSLGQLSQEVEVYSEAKPMLEGGSIKLALQNKNPIIFITYPPNRADAWKYLTDGQEFEGVYAMQGSDDWATGGWTATKILSQLLFDYDVTVSLPSLSAYDYDVAYYRIDPYSNFLSEFKKLFNGLPVIFYYNPQSASVEIKLAPFLTVDVEYDDRKSTTLRYTPQKMVAIHVIGSWGQPKVTASDQTFTFSPSLYENPSFPVIWMEDMPSLGDLGITKKTPLNYSKMTEGKLFSSYDLGTIREKNIKFSSSDAPTVDGDGSNQYLFHIEGERHEILNSIGLPITTLAQKSESIHKIVFAGAESEDINEETRIHKYQSHESFVMSYGESVEEIRSITRASKSLTIIRVKSGDSDYIYVPQSFSIVFHNYEDMLTDERADISQAKSPAIGRIKTVTSYQFSCFVQDKLSLDSVDGSRELAPVGTKLTFDPSEHQLTMYLTGMSTDFYDPIGASGYKTSTLRVTVEPATRYREITTDPGSGDGLNYISSSPSGPGYTKIRAVQGNGEPEFITIPCCNQSDADSYANLIYEYYKGYYQLTEVEDVPHCNTQTEIDMSPPERPGISTGRGLLTSVSKTITPFKTTYTRVYKFYD